MNSNKNVLHVILTVVLFGAIWGLLEATVGYILHFLPATISGLVMFPIGATLMYWAYHSTQKKSAIIYVGLIAAAIKAVNFAMPLPAAGPIKVLNPMISIVLQSLVVFGFSFLFERKTNPVKVALLQIGLIALAIVSWRALFLVNQSINYAITGNLPGQLKSIATMADFTLLNGLYELLILGSIYGIYRLVSSLLARKNIILKAPHWLVYTLAPLTLVAAILAVVLK